MSRRRGECSARISGPTGWSRTARPSRPSGNMFMSRACRRGRSPPMSCFRRMWIDLSAGHCEPKAKQSRGSKDRAVSLWIASSAAPPWNDELDLQNNARIADALIAFQQVHLLGLNLPAAVLLDEAIAVPTRENACFVAPEFCNQEIGPDHAGVLAAGR